MRANVRVPTIMGLALLPLYSQFCSPPEADFLGFWCVGGLALAGGGGGGGARAAHDGR